MKELQLNQNEKMRQLLDENENRLRLLTKENEARVSTLLEENESQVALMEAKHKEEERAAKKEVELNKHKNKHKVELKKLSEVELENQRLPPRSVPAMPECPVICPVDVYRYWYRLQRCISIIASLDRLLATIGKHRLFVI